MRFVLLGLLLASCFGVEARADQFALDKQHTDIRFSWDHLGLSRQSGKFTDMAGTVSFDSEKPDATTVNVTIPVASMLTGVPPLDTALVKTKDYFDAAAHPVDHPRRVISGRSASRWDRGRLRRAPRWPG